MSLRRFQQIAATIVATVLLHAPPLFAQSDVIRGRIVGSDSIPVEGARVTVTSIVSQIERVSRTDRNGRFTTIFPGADGHYVVSVSQIGYLVKTFELKRIADQDVLVADATLDKPQMDAVVVAADVRGTIPRGSTTADISGTQQGIGVGGLPPDQQGNLAAMAASLPGVLLIPGLNGAADGFSVLGLDPSDNSVTLNGMTFDGGNLPRDAGISGSLATSPYDVSRGGFSGGELALRSSSGSNIIRQGMSLNMILPQLHWSDLSSRAIGAQRSELSLSGVMAGPIKLNTSFYQVSFGYNRVRQPLRTLLNTNAFGLQAGGIASDSVTRMLGVLGDLGVPYNVGNRNDVMNDNATFLGSFNFNPPTSAMGSQYGITVNGNWGRVTPTGGAQSTTLPGSGSSSNNSGAGIQLRHTAYFKIFLSETGVGLSTSENATAPHVTMPAGRVRINSDLDDGSSTVRDLSFGGNQGAGTKSSQGSLNLTNDLSWFSVNNKHRLRLSTQLRYATSSSEQSSNYLGTFRYNSLADLENGIPASYSRQLTQRRDESAQTTGSVSLGDSYRYSPDLQFQYGIRVDGGGYSHKPEYNPLVEDVFGVRNDFVPNRLYVSPRFGFSLTLGTAPQLSEFVGAARAPRAILRGGIAVQQNALGAISSVVNNTGLPNSIQSLNCVGPATPLPDWELYLNNPELVPEQCADGTGSTVFSNSSPNVNLYSRNFSSPKSVRTNLSWTGPILDNRFSITLSGTHSLNLNRSSQVDLNFDPTVRFTLDSEGGRPVFVQPSSIVPTTGSIASRDSRVSSAFARVQEQRSDLRSETIQLQLNVRPLITNPNNRLSWSGSYIFQDVREQQRGFSSTVGNPLDIYWSQGTSNSRHQINYNLNYTFFRLATISWNGRLSSGRPYTPTIVGDVNGDGSSNDRPFIFDPANTADPALASAMQQLLENTSKDGRSCLMRQLGTLAARNSCQTKWEMTGNLAIRIDQARLRLPNRAQLSINFTNPMGGLDMLVNGSRSPKGWGSSQLDQIDQTLLYVRGFDPGTNTYRYEVNQRFGSPRQNQQIRVNTGVTAMISMDLGPTREQQTLTRNLRRGRTEEGTRYPETSIKSSGAAAIPNPITTVMRLQDSLQLSEVQADSLATLNRNYTIRIDSIWAVAAKHLFELPVEFSQGDAWQRYLSARRSAVDLLSEVGPLVRSLLTASQLRKLPASLHNTMDPRYLSLIRNGSNVYTANTAGIQGGSVPTIITGPGGVISIIR